MAIMGSGGIKRETDAATPFERHSQGFQPQNVNRSMSGGAGNSLPSKNNLSPASNLKNSKDIAKPSTGGANTGNNNPLSKAVQRRNSGNNYTRPNQPKAKTPNGTAGGGTSEAGSSLGNKNSLQDKNPLSNKKEGKSLLDRKGSSSSSTENEEEDDGKSETDKLREQIGFKVKNFLKKHPIVIFYIVLIIAIIAILYILLSAIIAVLSGGAAYDQGVKDAEENYGDFFAFEQAEIYLLDENGQMPIGSRTISLNEYVKGVVYADTMSLDLSGLTDDQLLEFYKAIILTKKAEILSRGKYSNKIMSMSLKVTDFNYCDASYGCKEVSKNGRRFFLSNGIEYNTDSVIKSYDALDSRKLSILNDAYNETASMVVTPSSLNAVLTQYSWGAPASSTSIYNSWISNAKNGTKAENLITGSFSGFKVYKLSDYALQFESTFLTQYSYWWPIGSATADANGLYSDEPTSTGIAIPYGPSFSSQTISKGITISGVCNSTKVIAIADGSVSYVGKNDSKYGNYVIVSHDNNIQSLYGSLSSISVSQGSKVLAGQLIGLVGSIGTNTSCGLYFEMYNNGTTVNPQDYVSANNPRVSKAKYIKFVQGVDNKQTVCKTFLASGFNKNAVAGLMANIERESGFRLDALSDGGTSNGLFQWHKGRLARLQSYCGAEYLTSIKCQLDYFLYEITETSEKSWGAYDYLMGNHSAYDMGYQFCMKFERPAGGATSAATRGTLAQNKYSPYVDNGCQ